MRVLDLFHRSPLLRSVCRLYAHAPTSSALHATLSTQSHLWQADMDKSFSFIITAVGHRKVKAARYRSVVEGFQYMALRGGVNLKNPEVTQMVIEEYDVIPGMSASSEEARDGNPSHVWFGRLISLGKARALISKYTVKERAHFGTTSMESEMSLLMASQAMAAPGRVVYDPFAGTGSMLHTSAHWGAIVVGSDIDGRQMRGSGRGVGSKEKRKEDTPGIFRTADQFGARHLFLDCLTFDVTKNPWRRGELFDAIVTDPPYGVRAGAKRLGRKESEKKKQAEEPYMMPNGVWAHE